MEPGMKNHTLMLADTESEKTKWVVALSELHRILKRNNLPNTTVRFFFLLNYIFCRPCPLSKYRHYFASSS